MAQDLPGVREAAALMKELGLTRVKVSCEGWSFELEAPAPASPPVDLGELARDVSLGGGRVTRDILSEPDDPTVEAPEGTLAGAQQEGV